ncbi:hypothetical protein M899_0521 [Bacteriovorax sp. BSW11_IV]|uniref:LysM peptidoglycan-binding domain-containing protein n=1 Tax=Bacteriovorax sp. BSW11_IV TaxID=1353529 RepID=UPI000389DFA4|nr:LysM peptidoglycan-binding domain-containing protein [Bacteriovorax sp. BSW11_IV]EQC44927.1 hypothetical protein M899_0521 [Bacteriovorax sp. BSW11_IV]
MFLFFILLISSAFAANEDKQVQKSFDKFDRSSSEQIRRIKEIAKDATRYIYTYKIEYGDFLHIIALRLYADANMWKQIAKWNDLKPPYSLETGRVLKLKKAPVLSPEDGVKLVIDFWRKFLLKNEPLEKYEFKVDKDDYRKKQKLELLNLKLKLAIKENRYAEAYTLMVEILNLTPVDTKVIFYWSLLLEKNGLKYESADIYSELIYSELRDYDDIEEAPFGKLNPQALSYVFISASKFLTVFKDENIDFDIRYKAFKRAEIYYKSLIKQKNQIGKSRLNLSYMYSDLGMYFNALKELYELQKNPELISNEDLKKATEFHIAVNKISSGAPNLALVNLKKIANTDESDHLGNSSQKIIDTLDKKRFSGHFAITRGIGTNVSALPDELSDTTQGADDAGYTQMSTGFNAQSIHIKEFKTNFRFLALYNRQDLTRYENLTNAYFSVNGEIYKSYYKGLLPKLFMGHSRLILNSPYSGGYHLKDYSYTHTLGASVETALRYGRLVLELPIGIHREVNNSGNDSLSINLNLSFRLWDYNKWLAPSFDLEYGNENYSTNNTEDQSTILVGITNYMDLKFTSLNMGIEYENLTRDASKETTLKYSLGSNTKLGFISKKLYLKISIEFDKEKRQSDIIENIDKKSYEAGLTFFF